MASYALMVEYKVENHAREQYVAWIRQLAEAYPQVALYEGADQPNLFVEVWPAASEEEARRYREERLSDSSSWRPIGHWVAGGMDRIHAWTFKPVLPG